MNCIDLQHQTSAEQLIKACLIQFYSAKNNHASADIEEEVALRSGMLKMDGAFDYTHRDMVIREVAHAMKCCGFRANFAHQTIASVTKLGTDTVKIIAGNKKIKDYASIKKQ